MEYPFKWDGTCLNKYNDITIMNRYIYEKKEYWDIEINKYRILCLAKCKKNHTPCIVDELKPLFGLEKLGTHYLKVGAKIYILTKIIINNSEIIFDKSLSSLSKDELNNINAYLADKILDIYVFKDLLRMKNFKDSDICIRTSLTKSLSENYPICCNDSIINFEKIKDPSSRQMPNINEIIWCKFSKKKYNTTGEILARMLKIYSFSRLLTFNIKFRDDVTKITERVSPNNYIYLSDLLLSVLNPILSSVISDSIRN